MTNSDLFHLFHGVLIFDSHVVHRSNISYYTLRKIVDETHLHTTAC